MYLHAPASILPTSHGIAAKHRDVGIIHKYVLGGGVLFPAVLDHTAAVVPIQAAIGCMAIRLVANGIDVYIFGALDPLGDRPLSIASGEMQRVMEVGEQAIFGYVKQLALHSYVLKNKEGAQDLKKDLKNKKLTLSKKWCFLVIVAIVFLCGVSFPFLLRAYDRWQRVKIVHLFALALQNQDFKEMAKWVLDVEREKLGVNEETIRRAFEHIKLPAMKLISLEALEADPIWAMVHSRWSLPKGNQRPVILISANRVIFTTPPPPRIAGH